MVFVEFQLEVGKQQYQKGKAKKGRTRSVDCIGNDEIKKSNQPEEPVCFGISLGSR